MLHSTRHLHHTGPYLFIACSRFKEDAVGRRCCSQDVAQVQSKWMFRWWVWVGVPAIPELHWVYLGFGGQNLCWNVSGVGFLSTDAAASTISAWWAHLAAMEAEWLLDKKVEVGHAWGPTKWGGIFGFDPYWPIPIVISCYIPISREKGQQIPICQFPFNPQKLLIKSC